MAIAADERLRPMGHARSLECAACHARERPAIARTMSSPNTWLREAGVAEGDVRLVIARDLASGEDHAVVTTHLDDSGSCLIIAA
jgi:hypothetical protein